jgi:hypothetical protein
VHAEYKGQHLDEKSELQQTGVSSFATNDEEKGKRARRFVSWQWQAVSRLAHFRAVLYQLLADELSF